MKLNGKKLADSILEEIKNKNTGNYKSLEIITNEKDEASQIYIRNKVKACEQCGVPVNVHVMKETDNNDTYAFLLKVLSVQESVGGIIVQLPAAPNINVEEISKYISDDKDIDGFKRTSEYTPCTPAGIITLIKHYKGDNWLEGKNAVVIGRSKIVGKPMADLLLNENATVTICHSKTKNISDYTSRADIVVSAVGKANFLTDMMLEMSATVVDVGMNRNIYGKLCGDCDESVNSSVFDVTPVPGGVGPMTVATLVSRVANK